MKNNVTYFDVKKANEDEDKARQELKRSLSANSP